MPEGDGDYRQHFVDTESALGALNVKSTGAVRLHAVAVHQADGAPRVDHGLGLAVLVAAVAEVVVALAAAADSRE